MVFTGHVERTNDHDYEIGERFAFSRAFDLEWNKGLKPAMFWTTSHFTFHISLGKQTESACPATMLPKK